MGASVVELPSMPKMSTLRASKSKQSLKSSKSPASTARSIKKGQPWSEEEHLQFLVGLAKVGKGNWRLISRYYVPSRTPTQVASHAQKHFIRQSGVTKRKSRFTVIEQAVCWGCCIKHLHTRHLQVSAAGILSSPCAPAAPAVSSSPPPSTLQGPPTPAIPDSPPPPLCKPTARHGQPAQLHKLHDELCAASPTLRMLRPSMRSAFSAPQRV